MSISIYSQYEKLPVKKFQAWKDSLLTPLAKKLRALGATADGVSAASAFIISASFLYSLVYKQPEVFVVGLWIHFLLDGLDGTIARTDKSKRKLNPIVDIAVDYSGIVAAVSMSWFSAVSDRLPALIFLSVYSLVIALTIWRRHVKKPYALVIRPRVIFYTALTIDIFFFTHLTEPIMWIGTALLIPPAITGLWVATKEAKKNLPLSPR